MALYRRAERDRELAVDRTLCAGRGVCAELLPDRFTIDEFGYPIATRVPADAGEAKALISACPARALYLTDVMSRS